MKKKIIFLCSVFISLIGQNISNIRLHAASMQPDGKIVCCGRIIQSENHGVLVLRYTTNGALDTSFGTDGLVRTLVNNSAEANALLIQPDGKILIAGYTQSATTELLIIRYLPDGSLDPSFGSSGITITSIEDGVNATAIGLQSDNKIIVTGTVNSVGQNKFFVARYTTSGLLDAPYGTGGIATTVIGNNARSTSLVVQPDNKVIIGGTTTSSLSQFVLTRFKTTGVLDTTFDSDGIILTPVGTESSINALALQPTGEIIATGSSDGNFALARYATTGSLDGTFGTGGIVTTDINGTDQINGIVLQPTGEIIAAGFFNTNTTTGFALARYTSTGSLDSSFGTGGIVTNETFSLAQAQSVVLQTDGKILPVGFSECGVLLFRYATNGILDASFGRKGAVFRPLNDTGCLIIDGGTGQLVFNACNFVNNSGRNPNALFFTFAPTTGATRPPLATWALNKSNHMQDPLSLTFQIPNSFDNTGSAEIEIHLIITNVGASGNSTALRVRADFVNNDQEMGTGGFSQTIISDDISITDPTNGNLRHVFTTISLDASAILAQDWAFLVLDRTAPSIPANEYDADIYLSSISFRYDQAAIN